jgi:hypothetical protein
MADNPDYGGTKINKKSKVSFQEQSGPPPRAPPQQMQMGPPPQQMGPPPPQQMGPPPQQMHMGPPPGMQMGGPPPGMQMGGPPPSRPPPQGEQIQVPTKSGFSKTRSKFGGLPSDVQHGLLVFVLFILLNSKIIWRQIMKLPFMGSTEPSMIALVVNSIMAAVVYFIITKYILN